MNQSTKNWKWLQFGYNRQKRSPSDVKGQFSKCLILLVPRAGLEPAWELPPEGF
jgi:hypothetical protein